MSLSTLQAELNRRVDDTLESDVSRRWLNISYKEALNYYTGGWPFLLAEATGSTVTDQQSYTLTSAFSVSDFGRPVQVWVDSTEYGRADWQDKQDESLAQKYAISPDRTSLLLFPTPTGDGTDNVTLRYVKYVADLVNSDDDLDDVPDLYKKEFEEAVVYGAMARYQETVNKPNLAQRYKDERANMLDTIITEVNQMSPNDDIMVFTDLNESGDDAF